MELLNLLASGLALGCVYALGAVGFVLLYKATGTVNFAQGDLVTLGAYLTIWAAATLGLGPLVGGLAAIALCALAGLVIERVAYYPLRNKPHSSVIISTLGAATVIRALLVLAFGVELVRVPSPVGLGTLSIGEFVISQQRTLVILGGITVLVGCGLLLNRSAVGRKLRAMAADAEMAQLVGVPTRGLSMFAWGLSGALAGLAGVLVGPLSPISVDFGFAVMLGGFAAAVLGGFGSLNGAIVAGVLLGLIEQVVGNYVFREFSTIYPFALMVAVIAFRPQGLFTMRSEGARL